MAVSAWIDSFLKELKEKHSSLFSILLYLAVLFFATPIYIKFHEELSYAYIIFFFLIVWVALIKSISSTIENIKDKTFKCDYGCIILIVIGVIIGMFYTKHRVDVNLLQLQAIVDNNYSVNFFGNYIITAANKSVFWAFARLNYILISIRLICLLAKTPNEMMDFWQKVDYYAVILEFIKLVIYTVVFFALASLQIMDRMFPG